MSTNFSVDDIKLLLDCDNAHFLREINKFSHGLLKSDLSIMNKVAVLAQVCDKLPTTEKKHMLEDYTYVYLTEVKQYGKVDAIRIYEDAFSSVIADRGMDLVGEWDGIQYRAIKNMNTNVQRNKVEYVVTAMSLLPSVVRDMIIQISFFDTSCPYDKRWQNEFSRESGRFTSNASGGDGEINIYMTDRPYSLQTFFHESGHCFDIGGTLSSSVEYNEAVFADYAINGARSISDYGENSVCEDFADSFAAYMLGNLDNFPNRLLYFESKVPKMDFSESSLADIYRKLLVLSDGELGDCTSLFKYTLKSSNGIVK